MSVISFSAASHVLMNEKTLFYDIRIFCESCKNLLDEDLFSFFFNGVFLHDVTAAMLVSQTKPLGIELYFYANTFFCFSKPIWPVVT